jgi:hypothetical protein
MKGSKLIAQCKKCQAFGHTQKFCSKEQRCVKCAGRHVTSDCQKSKTQLPKCVNCGEGHPANYRGCVVAKELQKIRNKKATQGEPVTNITTNYTSLQHKESPNNVHTNKATYASVAASDLNQ